MGRGCNLVDLNDILFEQLEKLSSSELEGEQLSEEIAKSDAVVKVATTIISNANTMLNAQKLRNDSMDANLKLPRMLENG